MKKIVFLLVSILVLSSSSVFAESKIVIENYKFVPNQNVSLIENKNVGVTEEAEVSIKGLSKPSSTKDLSGDASYYFSGEADGSTLYTNYLFTGNKSYKVQITNSHSTEDLKVKIYKDGDWTSTKTVTVPTDGETEFTVSGFETTDEIYIKFYAPSNFSGTID